MAPLPLCGELRENGGEGKRDQQGKEGSSPNISKTGCSRVPDGGKEESFQGRASPMFSRKSAARVGTLSKEKREDKKEKSAADLAHRRGRRRYTKKGNA